MMQGYPVNLTQAVSFMRDNLTEQGKATILSEDPRPVVNYLVEVLRAVPWTRSKTPFLEYVKSEFGLTDITDVAYLISQGIIADLHDCHFNPYDYASECRQNWERLGKDPLTGKKIVTIAEFRS